MGEACPSKWALAIHGGAGVISSNNVRDLDAARLGLSAALEAGRQILATGGSAIDAVEASVVALEDNPLFNAGCGAVYTAGGHHELEASLATSALQCGSVTLVRRTKNPIRLARVVMQSSPHVFLSGEAADSLAERHGLDVVEQTYYDTPSRYDQLQRYLAQDAEDAAAAAAGCGDGGTADDSALLRLQKRRNDELVQHTQTVGAVAVDAQGVLAAATSTGGRTAKWDGRIGDTPIHGAGNYACDHVAISGTGLGEEFIRHCVCKDVACRMQYLGEGLQSACEAVVDGVLQQGDGGVIAVDKHYNCCLHFNTVGMYHGAADYKGRFHVGIFKEDVADRGGCSE